MDLLDLFDGRYKNYRNKDMNKYMHNTVRSSLKDAVKEKK